MKEVLLGYHYTTSENWKQIQKDGFLRTREIINPEILSHFPQTKGIWVWDEDPKGITEKTILLNRATNHNSSDLVKLRIIFDDNSCFLTPPHGGTLTLTCVEILNEDMSTGVKARIWTQDIPIEKVDCINEFKVDFKKNDSRRINKETQDESKP